jgi:Na+/H+-dicarboxylate symporter
MIMILEKLGIPLEHVAFIIGVDRILDMCRTVVNVTGDVCVATIVGRSEGDAVGLRPEPTGPPAGGVV